MLKIKYLYHFTNYYGLRRILENGYIKTNCNSDYFETEFLSLSSDKDMIIGMEDAKYDNYVFRLCIPYSCLIEESLFEIIYDINYFKRNKEISSYIFTNLNDYYELLLSGNSVSLIQNEIKRLSKEKEFVYEEYISLDKVFEISFIDSYICHSDVISIKNKITSVGIDINIYSDWESCEKIFY